MTPDVPTSAEETAGVSASALAILVASAFVIGAAETITFLSMRSVMSLGGFVASGGPYVIAHQAPGWIVSMPVAIVALVIAMQTSKGLSDSRDTPSLMLLAWSALFLSLGYNFLDFGLHAPGGGGLSIGWLISAVAFGATGVGGLYAFWQSRKGVRELEEQRAAKTGGVVATPPGWRVYQIANTVSVAAGIAAGWYLFTAVAG